MEVVDSDLVVENWLRDNDFIKMPLPGVDYEPHLLISKVRKHYMDQIIKLLSINYETSQKLINKNIYLPSAIWRCAKILELNAAQNSMLVQLYRKNIIGVIKDLKNDTTNGKLYKKLLECLKSPPNNEKKTQANITIGKDCTCTCTCYQRKKVRKYLKSPKVTENYLPENNNDSKMDIGIDNGPVLSKREDCVSVNVLPMKQKVVNNEADDVMQQLEKLFEGGSNDEDIFDGVLCDSTFDITFNESMNTTSNVVVDNTNEIDPIPQQQADQNKSLDDRLASMRTVLESTISDNTKTEISRNKKTPPTKWLCEEYFLKAKLLELLDQIRDCNRRKFVRIKGIFTDLFGEDSDEESVMSPLEETPEFAASCKERITPWVVKLLTPYYVKGRIKGKSIFKALAKHLIRLIYQCSRYPEVFEVHDFIKDFLKNHRRIHCEADFKEFKIDNI